VGDDHGYPYAGFTGSDVVRTPHLDALAAGGTMFRRAFTTASTCRPSHRTLLTGLFPQQWDATLRAGQRPRGEGRAFDDVKHFATLPGLLAGHGYSTFQGGKLWEGRSYRDAGFTHGTKVALAERPSRSELAGGAGLKLGREGLEPVREFLEQARGAPFLIWFAPNLPHAPFDAGPEYSGLYGDPSLSPSSRGYFANVSRFDAAVGRLLEELEARALRDDTLVVYVSDNGWRQRPGELEPHGSAQGKLSIQEPGFHTPLIVSWPGRVRAGEVRDDLVSTADLFPTLLEFAGVASPAGRLGVSLVPTLVHGRPSPRREVFAGVGLLRPPGAPSGAIRWETAAFLRTPRWRYVSHPKSGREWLFDMERDPQETHDLAGAEPELAASLRGRLEAWLEAVSRPLQDERASGPAAHGGA
jgi:uncharacterized sulfatase